METDLIKYIVLLFGVLCTIPYGSCQTGTCELENVSDLEWSILFSQGILDTARGETFRRTATNIIGISSIEHPSDEVNAGPYLSIALEDGDVVVRLNDNFAEYEENELSMTVSITAWFNCNVGTRRLTVQHTITDTNNHAPRFLPSDVYEMQLYTNVGVGVPLTALYGDIIARDVDLTTSSIIFAIQPNDYVEILYDRVDDTRKNHYALLRTTNVIANLEQPLVLEIYATDVDATNDPPITTTATLAISMNPETQLPIAPAFERAFYTATYTRLGNLIFDGTIRLSEGHDNTVNFTLSGDGSSLFTVSSSAEVATVSLAGAAIPSDIIASNTHLVIEIVASKQFTSGASAAIIVSLPEPAILRFSENVYYGTISNNSTASIPQVLLEEGYEQGVNMTLEGVYQNYFTLVQYGNIGSVILSQDLLESILEENLLLTLTVEAYGTNAISARAVITLTIIQHEIVIPAFEAPYYLGTYDRSNGLSLNQEIFLSQGYDETVIFRLEEDVSTQYFDVNQTANPVQLTVSTIPESVIAQGNNLLFNIVAEKAGVQNAYTTVYIQLPATNFRFGESLYAGTIQDTLTVNLSPITFIEEYREGVTFVIGGDYNTYFTTNRVGDTVNLIISTPLTAAIIEDNTFINLILTATTPEGLTTSAVISLAILKIDIVQPIFSAAYYTGSYELTSGLNLNSEILLRQGYDDTVSFRLEGESAEYFVVDATSHPVALTVDGSISETVLETNKYLLFTLTASKPGAEDASVAVHIILPDVMVNVLRFDQIYYEGTIHNNTLVLPTLVVAEGFNENVSFSITGENMEFFAMSPNPIEGSVTLFLTQALPSDVIESSPYLNLVVEASAPDSITGRAVITLAIIKTAVTSLSFSFPYYIASYRTNEGLLFDSDIVLSEGYDDSVIFSIEGASSQYFSVQSTSHPVVLTVNGNSLPDDVLIQNSYLIFTLTASKPGANNTSTAIHVTLQDLVIEPVVFDNVLYHGVIRSGVLEMESITVLSGFTEQVSFNITGDYASYFSVSYNNGYVSLTSESLPAEAGTGSSFVSLVLHASKPGASVTQAAIVIGLTEIDNAVDPLIFGNILYRGAYANHALEMEDISIISGYDGGVVFDLIGDYSDYFQASYNSSQVSIALVTALPDTALVNVILSLVLEATKPEAITTRVPIIITLEQPMITGDPVVFDNIIYHSTYIEGNLTSDVIVINSGYENDVILHLTGTSSNYFSVSYGAGQVLLTLVSPLPDNVIQENNFLSLVLEAVKTGESTSRVPIVVNIIKPEGISDSIVFNNIIYHGVYDGTSLVTEAIQIESGLSVDISFSLSGEYTNYFEVTEVNSIINIALNSTNNIPDIIIQQNTFLSITLEASRIGSSSSRVPIIISLISSGYTNEPVTFGDIIYKGTYNLGNLSADNVIIVSGYTNDVDFLLTGEYSEYFIATYNSGQVQISTREILLPENAIEENVFLSIALEATKPESLTSRVPIIISLVKQESIIFNEILYQGSYSGGNLQVEEILVISGYTEDVVLRINGEYAHMFNTNYSNGVIEITLNGNFLPEIEALNTKFIYLILEAEKSNTEITRAVIIIDFEIDDESEISAIIFSEVIYHGSYYASGSVFFETIEITSGPISNISLLIEGEHSSYFNAVLSNNFVVISLTVAELPANLLAEHRYLNLILEASSPQASTTRVPLVVNLPLLDFEEEPVVLDNIIYEGQYSSEGFTMDPIIIISGYNENVTLSLQGDHASYFQASISNTEVLITLSSSLPNDVVSENTYITLVLLVAKPNTSATSAPLVIGITSSSDQTEEPVLLNNIVYEGQYSTEAFSMDPIIILSGYNENVTFSFQGDYANYFQASFSNGAVLITLAGSLPDGVVTENSFITLVLLVAKPNAPTTSVALIISFTSSNGNSTMPITFDDILYQGIFINGNLTIGRILVTSGNTEDVTFQLNGEYAEYFLLEYDSGAIEVSLGISALPESVITGYDFITLTIEAIKPGATTARTALIISTPSPDWENASVVFNSLLFHGSLENSSVSIEDIIVISGYTTDVEFTLVGNHSQYFTPTYADGLVQIDITLGIPDGVLLQASFISLVLQAAKPGAETARSVIVIDVQATDAGDVEPPTVLFSSDNYAISISPETLGAFGFVAAVASNGESINYALQTDDDYLQERLRIGGADGQLSLSSYLSPGRYQFSVTASTSVTLVSATAEVNLSVESILVCPNDNFYVDPLIIMDRDEEEPYNDLVVINEALVGICTYSIINQWPSDRSWFYISETGGLSCNAIDREDEAIAYLPLSQAQVELLLTCTGDDQTVSRIETNSTLARINNFVENISPISNRNDTGNMNWIITENIPYSPRYSKFNLIVNDINDNEPIFVGKENEPLVYGYPIDSILNLIGPPSFTTVKATDADIGINAHIMYSTESEYLTIHPDTGNVYIRDNVLESITDEMIFTVFATDEYGQGHTTSLNLQVRLLNTSHILILTVQNAYLEDAETIIDNLNQRLGLNVRSLRNFVSPSAITARNKVDVTGESMNFTQRDEEIVASLRLYIYVLNVENNPLNNVEIVSALEESVDESFEWIMVGIPLSDVVLEPGTVIVEAVSNNSGLLISTVLLSILLILLILFFIGFYMYLRRNRYKNFTDDEISRRSSMNQQFDKEYANFPYPSLPETNQTNVVDVVANLETVLENDPPSTNPFRTATVPIVPTDNAPEEDEFGEVKVGRRKSVVTFNEHVEKIHIEKLPEEDNVSTEIYRL